MFDPLQVEIEFVRVLPPVCVCCATPAPGRAWRHVVKKIGAADALGAILQGALSSGGREFEQQAFLFPCCDRCVWHARLGELKYLLGLISFFVGFFGTLVLIKPGPNSVHGWPALAIPSGAAFAMAFAAPWLLLRLCPRSRASACSALGSPVSGTFTATGLRFRFSHPEYARQFAEAN